MVYWIVHGLQKYIVRKHYYNFRYSANMLKIRSRGFDRANMLKIRSRGFDRANMLKIRSRGFDRGQYYCNVNQI